MNIAQNRYEKAKVDAVSGPGIKVTTAEQDMKCKRSENKFAVSNFVDDESSNDDSKAETRKACSSDHSEVGTGKAIIRLPASKIPPRMAKPTPAARIAMNPAYNNRVLLS